MNLEELEKEYTYKSSVNFEGNDEVDAFYGHVVGFSEDTDGSIYVTLRDMDDNNFDIDWKEVEHSEFDSDSYLTEDVHEL